uniref:Disease resistance N-terminal domain-containing protein n=4 Tax=Triticinae TaxID=1648030 RepID=A0A453Q3T8_AEGTS
RNTKKQPKMEMVVTAIAGDLVNRFISFLIKKHESHANLEKKVERLQQLLLRIHMVVEEAEGRYITNSRMLLELKRLSEAMYQGYHVLDTIKYKALCSTRDEKKVSSSSNALSLTNSIKCFHTNSTNCFHTTRSTTTIFHDLDSVLENLETMVSNMTEFVVLVGGCERMPRSPYDTYLYIDNFMFGRQVEKQQIMNVLLQENIPPFAPTVLPIISTNRVGKKTLVAHVCNNDRVRSHFSLILRLKGESIHKTEHGAFVPTGRTLVVLEFTSDIDDVSWQKFYSTTRRMGKGSKIIIISRIESVSRLGTIRPMHLNSLSLEEYSYLFKVLAFGSTNPDDHPRLSLVASELAVLMGGSLVVANVCADIFRKNQNLQFWQHILNKYRNFLANNFSVFCEHPKLLIERDRPVDISKLVSSTSAPLRLMPPHCEDDDSTRDLPKVRYGDLIAGSVVPPREKFELVGWESRIPPYKKYVNVAMFSGEVNVSEHVVSPCKKRIRFS